MQNKDITQLTRNASLLIQVVKRLEWGTRYKKNGIKDSRDQNKMNGRKIEERMEENKSLR